MENQKDFNTTENILCVTDIKQEPENFNDDRINRIDQGIPMSDTDICYQVDSKIDIKEEDIVPWKEEYLMEALASNNSVEDLNQEKLAPIPLFNEDKVNHNRKRINPKRVYKRGRAHKCDVCEKSFYYNSDLIQHKLVHTGERPYKCGVCEKSFSQISNLNRHKRIHVGERPYICAICEKNFIEKQALIRHVRIHTGERPHKCNVCKKSFSRKSNYIRHKRLHKGDTLP